jgi:nicotinamidase-related amidase
VTEPSWLVGIDLQRVFGDPASAWCAPRYDGAMAQVARLAPVFADRTVLTRFVAPQRPQGAWAPYYEEFPWALVGDEDPLYALTDEAASLPARVVTASTFGKWAELLPVVGERPHLVVTGVATDCCVISTVLAAADAGASVTVVSDACAGSTDDNHRKALEVMALYGPLVTLATTNTVLDELGY